MGQPARDAALARVWEQDPRLRAPYQGQVPSRLRDEAAAQALDPIDTCAIGRVHADGTPVRSINQPMDPKTTTTGPTTPELAEELRRRSGLW